MYHHLDLAVFLRLISMKSAKDSNAGFPEYANNFTKREKSRTLVVAVVIRHDHIAEVQFASKLSTTDLAQFRTVVSLNEVPSAAESASVPPGND